MPPSPCRARTHDQYYRGFSNGMLWPVFHCRPDRELLRPPREYAGYCRVNHWLVERLKPMIEPGDILWVHDLIYLLPFASACAAGIRKPHRFLPCISPSRRTGPGDGPAAP